MALDKVKLLLKNKIETEKAAAKFKINLEIEKLFAQIPNKMQILTSLSLIALDLIIREILDGGYTAENTKNFVRKDMLCKNIISESSNDTSDDIISDIIKECFSEDPNPESLSFPDNLNASELLEVVGNSNDIDRKVDKNRILSLQEKINNAYASSQAALLLVGGISSLGSTEILSVQYKIQSFKYTLQYIVNSIKDLFEKTLHPSQYRTKFLQRVIRNLYGLVKEEYERAKGIAQREYESIKNELEKILNALKRIDDILIAATFVTTLYITNKLLLLKKSKETLKQISEENTCQTQDLEEFDVSINNIPLEIGLSCPVVEDNIITPHTPFAQKLENLSCEIELNEEVEPEVTNKVDLTTHAIIRNNKEELLTPLITKDSFVDQDTVLGNIGETSIYSPVLGFVEEVSTNEIIIRDIDEPEQDSLQLNIDSLNTKYEKINDIKAFIKAFNIRSLYPVMLSISAIDDSSTNNIFIGIDDEYDKIKKRFKDREKNYEKSIKKITGKDNVEKNAKDETLYKIKEDIDKADNTFYAFIDLLQEEAINISKRTRAKSNEYELFEFYSLDLGAKLNGLENPSKIEKEFRDIINEFTRKRVVIDEYKKSKLEDKIDNLIKELEKGITWGNWFKKAYEIYDQNKKVSEVEVWLNGIARKNNKLTQIERDGFVHKIIFLFELYLNYDSLIKKYNVLKKESTPKKETIKEGNTILEFIQKYKKEYENSSTEIKEIEDTIDKLSIFSAYSITTWNGYEARLYSLDDDIQCEVSEEIDPYLNPKSKYEFKDIQYWLKYCSFATLTSVSNPATGWSTGLLTPAPVLLPVVYIPFKAITTSFGFIVLGITVCGIYISPFSLFVNLSTQFRMPFLDPTTLIKKEIQALKIEISRRLKDLREITIRPLLEETEQNINQSKQQIEDLKTQYQEVRLNRPVRYNRDETALQGVISNVNFVVEYGEWLQNQAEIQELILTEQVNLFSLQVKHKILREALDLGKSIQGITTALEALEEFINKQLDRLIKLIESINISLSVLPFALSPETANFGITLKNPRPIINITDELDDNVNIDILENVRRPFNLKNSDLLSTNLGQKLSSSIINYNQYLKILSASMTVIISKEAFPKYENLKITNLKWLLFLYKDFTSVGAKTYGFPGNLPLPI